MERVICSKDEFQDHPPRSWIRWSPTGAECPALRGAARPAEIDVFSDNRLHRARRSRRSGSVRRNCDLVGLGRPIETGLSAPSLDE